MRLTHSRILIAGGAGFIGSHIVDRLLEEDVQVTILDNLFTGLLGNIEHNRNNKKLKLIKGDLRNSVLVKRLVKNADAVFNDAAVVSVPRSVEDPLLANQVNVDGALNLLKACLDSGVKRFVQASSASVYGDTQSLPITEDLPTKPISPYAVSELAAENYAHAFYSTYGLETVCLRYFNVYGPRQTCSKYSGVTTIFVNQLLQNKPPIIFGDGKQTRDFVYVEDVVNANILALTKKRAAGEVFNIATNKATTINTLVSTLQEIMNKKHLKPIYKAARRGDIIHSCASIEKATKILGYKPQFSLKKGLTKLAEWYAKEKQQESAKN